MGEMSQLLEFLLAFSAQGPRIDQAEEKSLAIEKEEENNITYYYYDCLSGSLKNRKKAVKKLIALMRDFF